MYRHNEGILPTEEIFVGRTVRPHLKLGIFYLSILKSVGKSTKSETARQRKTNPFAELWGNWLYKWNIHEFRLDWGRNKNFPLSAVCILYLIWTDFRYKLSNLFRWYQMLTTAFAGSEMEFKRKKSGREISGKMWCL